MNAFVTPQKMKATMPTTALPEAIAPAPALVAGERQVASVAARRENREVWPWLALAGLALLAVEWHLYSRRSWL